MSSTTEPARGIHYAAAAAAAPHYGHGHPKRRDGVHRIRQQEQRRSSGLVWALVILCTVLAIGVIVTGATVFAVYLLYKPKTPYLLVSDARLETLVYDQSGTIRDLQLALTVLAENSNSKTDAIFSAINGVPRRRGPVPPPCCTRAPSPCGTTRCC